MRIPDIVAILQFQDDSWKAGLFKNRVIYMKTRSIWMR